MTTSEGFRILGDDPSNQQSCLLDLDLKGATRIPKPKEKSSSPFSCKVDALMQAEWSKDVGLTQVKQFIVRGCGWGEGGPQKADERNKIS